MLRRKQIQKLAPSRERGVSLPEMALGGALFFTLAFGILEIGRAMAAYNALSEAVRRGARYACMNTATSAVQVKNMVVFGTPTAGAQAVAPGLTAANVFVTYSTTPPYGVNSGWVKVEVRNYTLRINVPMVGNMKNGTIFSLRPFVATANAENAGVLPGNI